MNLVGVFVTVGTAVLTARALTALALRLWRTTIGRRRVAYSKLNALSATARLKAIEQILGPATTTRSETKGDVTYWEHVFVDPLFYVQAIVDKDDTVLRFAVTSRHRRFRPKFLVGRHSSKQMTVQLGTTRFATLPIRPNRVTITVGARRRWHEETYYLGNPGDYQYFHLAVVDAAPGIEDHDLLKQTDMGAGGVWSGGQTEDPKLISYRAGAGPNTYGETQPNGVDDPFPIGVDNDLVRVLRQ